MGAVLARLLGLNVRALRIFGSTALCLAWVAAGRASVFQHAQRAPALAGPQLRSCASSGRAWPGGSGRLGTPRKRPAHGAPSHCLGCSREPPPNLPPMSPPSSTQAFYAGLHKRDCPKQWDWCAGHAIVCAAGGVFVRHGSDAEQARPFDIDCAGGVCAGTPALAAVLQRELLAS